jgi:hypothetical protein
MECMTTLFSIAPKLNPKSEKVSKANKKKRLFTYKSSYHKNDFRSQF